VIFGSVYAHAPTEAATDAEKDKLWLHVIEALDEIKLTSRDLRLLPGDYNGEVGWSELFLVFFAKSHFWTSFLLSKT
jgi:hypothetical protein